jgi:hypothetical protein
MTAELVPSCSGPLLADMMSAFIESNSAGCCCCCHTWWLRMIDFQRDLQSHN